MVLSYPAPMSIAREKRALVGAAFLAAGACSSSEPGSAPDPSPDGAVPSADAQVLPEAAPPSPDAFSTPDATNSSSFRISVSPSPFAEILFKNALRLTDGPRAATDLGSLVDLFAAHGATEVFARIGTRKTKLAGTGDIDSSLAPALARAQIAAERGLPLNPELGLFRTYGDVSCQTPPDFSDWGITLAGPWETLAIDQMTPAVRAFTAAIATEILKSGVRVEVWDIGNEVDFGVAGVAPMPLPGACDSDEGGAGWYRAPNGVDGAIGAASVLALLQMSEPDRITWLRAHVWPHEAKLLAAAAEGIRSVSPGAKVETHISKSTSPTFAVAFYQAMKDGGLVLDAAGFSFYPTASTTPPDRLHQFRLTVEAVKNQLGLASFIAECAYPATALTGMSYFSTWNNALASYPISDAIQAAFYHDLASWGASGALTGIRPWAPDLFVGDWAPFSFFVPKGGTTGGARLGLDAIREGSLVPNPDALKE
jgi:Glycosyl hydrolase family 53